VASRFRKVPWRLLDERPPVPLELLLPEVLLVDAGFWAFCACKGAVISGLIP
jgi:hypothetical protein